MYKFYVDFDDYTSNNKINDKKTKIDHNHNDKPYKNNKIIIFYVILFLNILLMFSQIIVSIITRSLAVLSDSLDSLIDILSICLPLLSLYLSKKCLQEHNCGFKNVLDDTFSIISACLMFSYRFVILINAVTNIFREPEINNPIVLIIIGSLGIFLNTISIFLIPHQHEHNDNEHHKNLNFSVVVHILSDVFGSVIILMIGLQLFYTKDVFISKYIDIFSTIVISLIAITISIYTIIKNLKIKYKKH